MRKAFKGQIADDEQQVIRLSTNNGLTGYKIVKFQVMPRTDEAVETSMKIYKHEQSTITNDIDFNDNTLLAACFFGQTAGTDTQKDITIFDLEIFNQDIFITLKGHSSPAPLNYYLELEQVKLDINEATVATVKDMRGRE